MGTNVVCPHCTTGIHVMTASEVVEETRRRGWEKFQIGYLPKMIKAGTFPVPWMAAAGRQFWLVEQYEQWWDDRENGDKKKMTEALAGLTADMTDAEFKRYMRELDQLRKQGRN